MDCSYPFTIISFHLTSLLQGTLNKFKHTGAGAGASASANQESTKNTKG